MGSGDKAREFLSRSAILRRMKISRVVELFKDLPEGKNKYRAMVLARYGPSCRCCGEDLEEALTIDHVNDDGKFDRDGDLATKVVKLGFPDTFQILCYNCNLAKYKAKTGFCPHAKIRALEDMAAGEI